MDYIARLEAHLRITRGRVLPLVTFARYSDDDPMQPADPKLPRCETKKNPHQRVSLGWSTYSAGTHSGDSALVGAPALMPLLFAFNNSEARGVNSSLVTFIVAPFLDTTDLAAKKPTDDFPLGACLIT